MQHLNKEIEEKLASQGAKLVRFVDVSHLSEEQNRQLPNGIAFVIPLTTPYIKEVCATPDYVAARIADNYRFDDDEYSLTEIKVGALADDIAGMLVEKGYRAHSQSDPALIADYRFDETTHSAVLPNKTIAGLAGIGWIGKNNLLITPQYGAAQCIGTLLTDASLDVIKPEILAPKCGHCNVCVEACEKNLLKGKSWSTDTPRDEIVDIYGCTTCLKCLVHCARTTKYVNQASLY